jgi:hypothetical protein
VPDFSAFGFISVAKRFMLLIGNSGVEGIATRNLNLTGFLTELPNYETVL